MALDDKVILERDKQYKRLMNQKSKIGKELLQRKIVVLKRAGVIVDSPEQLKCDNHESGVYMIRDPHTRIYECDSCGFMVSNPAERSKAYECPRCGTVKGNCREESKTSPLGNCNIETFYCRICNIYLGKKYSEF